MSDLNLRENAPQNGSLKGSFRTGLLEILPTRDLASFWLSAFWLGAFCLLFTKSAQADPPVSLGNSGAVERATLNAAGPGAKNPQFDPIAQKDASRFGIQLRIPFLPLGDSSDADFNKVVPLTVTPEGPNGFIPALSMGSPDGSYQMQLGVVSTSFGHGSLIHRLVNSPNGHRRRLGAMAGFNLISLSGQVMVADVLDPLAFTAARVTLKPLVFMHSRDVSEQPVEFNQQKMAAPLGRWTLGLTAATDFTALASEQIIASNPNALDTAAMNAVGIDNQLIVTDTEQNTLIFYVDVNWLNRFGRLPGMGTHLGVESMMHIGSIRLKLDVEGNMGGAGYIPRYFDQSYFVERIKLIGSLSSKWGADAPASFGYLARSSIVLSDKFSLFGEIQDQFPVINTQGRNSARFALGSSFDWLMFGGTLSVSQAGIQDYNQDLFGSGLLFIAEGRVSLFFDYLQLIGRYYLQNLDGKESIQGGFLGLEINLFL